MRKYLHLLVILPLLACYFIVFNGTALSTLDPLWVWLMVCLSLWGFRAAWPVALTAGLLMDLHFYSFGRYLVVYFLGLTVIYLIQRFLIAGQSRRSRLLLYLVAALVYLLLLTGFSLPIGGWDYLALSSDYFMRTALTAALAVILMSISYYLLSNRLARHEQ